MRSAHDMDLNAALFWLAAVVAAIAAYAMTQPDPVVEPAPALPPTVEAPRAAPDATVDLPTPDPGDQYSIFSENGVHAGVMAF